MGKASKFITRFNAVAAVHESLQIGLVEFVVRKSAQKRGRARKEATRIIDPDHAATGERSCADRQVSHRRSSSIIASREAMLEEQSRSLTKAHCQTLSRSCDPRVSERSSTCSGPTVTDTSG
jgi:hypothetical protein